MAMGSKYDYTGRNAHPAIPDPEDYIRKSSWTDIEYVHCSRCPSWLARKQSETWRHLGEDEKTEGEES